MELTIEQTLQQGVAAHKEGKLQEAERLYRTVLQSQPAHPDANHNLGVIAVSMNQSGVALPLFKKAIKVNSNIEQFWLSYIEALIVERQFENAKRALKKGKKKGVAKEKLKALTQKLVWVKAGNNLVQAPPQAEIQKLLNHYQNGQYGDAEKLAISVTEQFPEHQLGWKVLGAVLKQTGRVSESLVANQKAVQLAPQGAEAHNNLGATLREVGRLEEAEASLRQAIVLKPDYAQAHNNLGVTLKELGRLEEAEASYRQAIALKSDYAEAHNNLGATLQEVGRLEEGEVSLRQAIVLKPDYAEAHSNLGAALLVLGRLEEAEASLRQATALKPGYDGAHNNLGNILKELGRLEEAEASYRQAIAVKPDNAEAHYNMGITVTELGKLDEAEASYRQAIALKPGYVEAHNNLGNALKGLGRLEEAEASLRQATALKPGYVEAHNNLGNALKGLGRLEEAEASYRQAIALKPDNAEAHYNMGITVTELGKLNEAEASYRQAIALKPDYAEAHNNLGNILKELGRLEGVEASYRQAIALKPDFAEAHSNLGSALRELGRLEEALASYNKAIALKVDFSEAYSSKNFCLSLSSLWSPLFIYKQHLEFEKQFGGLKVEPPFSLPFKKDFGERLRIGYVSPDFRTHSVAYFFEPLLQHHSGHVVETFCYYNNTVVDATTKRLMAACDHWRSIFGITDSDVANLIRNDKIDILVDLSGHTAGNRLLVFAQKPAPVQVTWLGGPNTTGLSAIDYRFTDIIADPKGEADELHSETLFRLPNGFQCYQGNEKVHVDKELPQKSREQITFGSFNNLLKLTPEVIKTWSKILHAVPTSSLVLKSSMHNSNTTRYHELFRQEGIAKERIECYGRLPSVDEHLGLYNAIDIGLDPFPYNGATTTCEALWMGVPVIALLGDRHVARVGASILTNVGLTDFIAQDIDGYIQLAVEMAANTNYLKEIRKGLRERMQGAPLCDARSFASDVETAYQDMWRKYLK